MRSRHNPRPWAYTAVIAWVALVAQLALWGTLAVIDPSAWRVLGTAIAVFAAVATWPNFRECQRSIRRHVSAAPDEDSP